MTITRLVLLLSVAGVSHGVAVIPISGELGWRGAAAAVHAGGGHGLAASLDELLALVPTNAVLDVLVHFMQTDPDVEAALQYLESAEFRAIATVLDSRPEFTSFLKYLQDNGVDVYDYLNELRDMIGVYPLVPPVLTPAAAHQRTARSLNDMLAAMMDVIPTEEIAAMFEHQLQNDSSVQQLVERMRSAQFQVLVDTMNALPQFQDMLQGLRAQAVDVDAALEALKEFFGWRV